MEWMLLPLKRYAEFSGRSRRMEFWMWQLFKFLINLVFGVVMVSIAGTAGLIAGPNASPLGITALGGGAIAIYVIQLLIGLGLLIPDIAVSVRRLHDTNRSGWWLLAPLGALVAALVVAAFGRSLIWLCVVAAMALGLVLLVFFFLDGTIGANRFGPDPKGRAGADVFA